MIRRLTLALCLLASPPLFASEPSGVYMQVPLSSQQLSAWLASPLPQAAQFHDWAQMNPDWDEAWRSYFVTLPAASVGEFLAGWQAPPEDHSGMAWCHDPAHGELRLGAVFFDENYVSFATLLAALRGASDHQQSSEPGYVYIYSHLWGDGPDALLRTLPGLSELLPPDSAPQVLQEAAEAFLDARMQGWQPADAQRRCLALPATERPGDA